MPGQRLDPGHYAEVCDVSACQDRARGAGPAGDRRYLLGGVAAAYLFKYLNPTDK